MPQRNPRLGCKQSVQFGKWEKVVLRPCSDFIAKNQLAREGSQTVSPVIIPALTTIVDKQFEEDKTLCLVCLVWALGELDCTQYLRGSRSLLIISFKKGHTSDSNPATLSYWLNYLCATSKQINKT